MELLHGCITSESRGQAVVHPTREQYLPLMKELIDEGYVVCTDLCGVDYLVFPERCCRRASSPSGSRSWRT